MNHLVSLNHEQDQVGWHTLETLSEAPVFNRWTVEHLTSYLKPGTCIEIGSGLGNLSRFLLDQHDGIYLTDIQPHYLRFLQDSFKLHPACLGVSSLDLTHPNFCQTYPRHVEAYDYVIASNVIEHLPNDRLAFSNLYHLLKSGGRALVVVPAYPTLYSLFDLDLGHFRRYEQRQLAVKLEAAGLRIVESYYYNLVGIFGWWTSGKVLKNRALPSRQVRLFNQLMPIVKIVDKFAQNRWGLSLFAVAQKP